MPQKFVFERSVQHNSGYSQCVAEIGLEYLFLRFVAGYVERLCSASRKTYV